MTTATNKHLNTHAANATESARQAARQWFGFAIKIGHMRQLGAPSGNVTMDADVISDNPHGSGRDCTCGYATVTFDRCPVLPGARIVETQISPVV